MPKFDLIISPHARERWIVRIVNPTRYAHLDQCTGCEVCTSLLHELRNIVKIGARQIDGRIAATFRHARDKNSRVTDVSFLEAIRKKHGDEAAFFDFLVNGNAVMMLSRRPEQEVPLLVTVMTTDMIDGTVIRRMSNEEMKTVFQRWKTEAKSTRT